MTDITGKIDFMFSSDNTLSVRAVTERLIIRSYEDKDYDDCFSLYSDPRLMKYFDEGIPFTQEMFDKFLIKTKSFFNLGKPFGLFVVELRSSGEFVGIFDFFPAELENSAEVGVIIKRQYHTNGYGHEGLLLIINEYSRLLSESNTFKVQIDQIIATAHPKNYASIRLIRSLKMQYLFSKSRFGNDRNWYNIHLKEVSL